MGEMLTVALPGPHGLAVLALTVLALFLFTRDRIPIESSSMLVILAFARVNITTPTQTHNMPVCHTHRIAYDLLRGVGNPYAKFGQNPLSGVGVHR